MTAYSASNGVLHLGYPEGVKSTSLSFYIAEEQRLRLEWTARHLKKSKNWILNRALEESKQSDQRFPLCGGQAAVTARERDYYEGREVLGESR